MSAVNMSDSTGENPTKSASAACDNELIGRVQMSLLEAHSILDLIHTMTSVDDCSDEHVESLGRETLNGAVYSAMSRIREAQEASGKLASSRAVVQA